MFQIITIYCPLLLWCQIPIDSLLGFSQEFSSALFDKTACLSLKCVLRRERCFWKNQKSQASKML